MACTHRPHPWSQKMCLTGTLASAKGTPCYIVIVVYYCGGHSKRKTLMMSTYNLTMANPTMVPRGGGHGRIAPWICHCEQVHLLRLPLDLEQFDLRIVTRRYFSSTPSPLFNFLPFPLDPPLLSFIGECKLH